MPLEHRWEDLQTPVRSTTPRERKALKGAAGFLAVCVIAVIVGWLLIAPERTQAGCINIIGASTMGASNYRACGSAAKNFCDGVANHSDQQARQMAAKCRDAGIS